MTSCHCIDAKSCTSNANHPSMGKWDARYTGLSGGVNKVMASLGNELAGAMRGSGGSHGWKDWNRLCEQLRRSQIRADEVLIMRSVGE